MKKRGHRMRKKYLSVKKQGLGENHVKKGAKACSYWNNHVQRRACYRDVSAALRARLECVNCIARTMQVITRTMAHFLGFSDVF